MLLSQEEEEDHRAKRKKTTTTFISAMFETLTINLVVYSKYKIALNGKCLLSFETKNKSMR